MKLLIIKFTENLGMTFANFLCLGVPEIRRGNESTSRRNIGISKRKTCTKTAQSAFRQPADQVVCSCDARSFIFLSHGGTTWVEIQLQK